jgi:hypothetical protein
MHPLNLCASGCPEPHTTDVMLNLSPTALSRYSRMAILLIAAIGLGACGDLAASLPPRPSPFPTLVRLPSVTPVTPSPSPLPSSTPVVQVLITPTPTPPIALVAVAANMRSGPGLEFAVVAVLNAGSSIILSGRQEDWYQVQTADGLDGWMSAQVLEIEPSVADSLPQIQP